VRVLIVEDERRLAQTLADLMEAHNYGADIAYDGEEGLEVREPSMSYGAIYKLHTVYAGQRLVWHL